MVASVNDCFPGETAEDRRRSYQREYMRRWREANLEKSRESTRKSVGKWRDANPDLNKERKRDDYIKHKDARYASQKEWKARNPDRVRELSRDHYWRHVDEQRERNRKWAKDHPEQVLERVNRRRAIKVNAGGEISAQDWQEIKAQFGGKCLKCGRNDLPLTMDHIIPLFVGGTNDPSNIQPLCKPCNSSKGINVIDYRTREDAH